jgi:succinoglycan biosynthesis transport protein ExoP
MMSLNYLFRVLLARKLMVLLVMVTVVALAGTITAMLPKTYKATAQMVLDYRGTDPVAGINSPTFLSPGYITTYLATQADIVMSRHTALLVIDSLGLARDEKTLQKFREDNEGNGDYKEWLAQRLLKQLDLDFARDSSVMNLTYKANTAQRAADIANAFAEQYRATVIRLKAEPLESAAAYLGQQVRELRESLEQAQRKLSSYQQKEGLVLGSAKVDMESERLNELSTQMLQVQAELAEAEARHRQLLRGRVSESPEVVGNALILALTTSLAAAQGRLEQLREKFEPAHPQYIAAQGEIDQLRRQIAQQTNSIRNSVGNALQALQMRADESRRAYESQKALVLRLRDPQDQLNVLAREVDNAQKAFDIAVQRLNQTRIEGQAKQSNITLLTRATPPFLPSSPRVLLYMLLAVFAGTMLGVGMALMAELFDRRLRTLTQLAQVTGAPILGVVRRSSGYGTGSTLLLPR